MAWEDRTPFDAIEEQFGLSESQVIKLMKREMKLKSWKMWRERGQDLGCQSNRVTIQSLRAFILDLWSGTVGSDSKSDLIGVVRT